MAKSFLAENLSIGLNEPLTYFTPGTVPPLAAPFCPRNRERDLSNQGTNQEKTLKRWNKHFYKALRTTQAKTNFSFTPTSARLVCTPPKPIET